MKEQELADLELFYAVVLYGKFRDIAQVIDYIKNFSDVKIVFDRKAPFKLYITEKPPKEGKT
ncbi:MAG: hypothetical protein NZ932_07255 [Candidatus Bathyarchaeota archaeon]|nr:hypothetical protein [Candidatus Bathyarchaeota archaeon]